MKKENIDLIGFVNLTQDEGVLKKVTKQGFGAYPTDGQEITVHYISSLEDGRGLENTYVTKDPSIYTLGNYTLIPGLEIAIKNMKMGEGAIVRIKPEYGYLALDKLKNCEDKSTIKIPIEVDNPHSQIELSELNVKDAQKYLTVIYEIELIKFDKHRKSKQTSSPDERISEAAILKNEGNDLFKEKRYMEAIVKYNDGLHYLSQMPTEFLSQKVYDLRIQINLNITNCHICLNQYNYALKKLEEIKNSEIFTQKNSDKNVVCPKGIPAKFFYYRCTAYMNLGEFDLAYEDLENLDLLLPNDPMVKKLREDYEILKARTTKQKKELLKKGLFSNGLYNEKPSVQKQTDILPKFNKSNKCFYIDFIINGNLKDPQKIKIEIFQNNSEKYLNYIYQYLDKLIKSSSLKNSLMSVRENNILLWKLESTDLEKNTIYSEISDSKYNIYPPCENYLFILKKSEDYNFEILTQKLSDNLVDGILVIGRCYYNINALEKMRSNNYDKIEIVDCDYTYNI